MNNLHPETNKTVPVLIAAAIVTFCLLYAASWLYEKRTHSVESVFERNERIKSAHETHIAKDLKLAAEIFMLEKGRVPETTQELIEAGIIISAPDQHAAYYRYDEEKGLTVTLRDKL